MKTLIEILGWYGAAAIVGAYALGSFSLMDPTDLPYQLLNATGAFCVMIISFYKKAYQPGTINLIWTVIAVIAIIQISIAQLS